MNHLLFILGEEILINEPFKDYIIRAYKEKFKDLKELKFASKIDKNLPFILEELLLKYDFITLFAQPSYHATIAKIISTLSDDVLVLKDEVLVPDKAQFIKNSYLCEFELGQKPCKINVLSVSLNETLPVLLGEYNLNYAYFCLYSMDAESANLLLQTLSSTYRISLCVSELLSDLVLIKAQAFNQNELESFLQGVSKLFGSKFFLGGSPVQFIASRLLEKDLKISFAESCTGGLLASALTSIEGVSAIFEGSLVTYSKRLKHEWLGVSEAVLEGGGVYSERCIYFMLKGLFKTANPDFAVAISGVASGEDEGFRAGEIFIGAMYRDGTFLQEKLSLKGDREFIRRQALNASFMLLPKLKNELFEVLL